MISGIYKIWFEDTNWFYLGSCSFFSKRINRHLTQLKNQKHPNFRMQNIYNKYPEKFNFRLIQEVPKKDLLRLEQLYLDSFKPNINIKNIVGGGSLEVDLNCFEIEDLNTGIIYASHSLNSLAYYNNISVRGLYNCINGICHRTKNWRVLSKNGDSINNKDKRKSTLHKARSSKIGKRLKDSSHKENISISKSKKWLITDPSNISFCVIGLSNFCKNTKLDKAALLRVSQNKANHHKGFKCQKIE